MSGICSAFQAKTWAFGPCKNGFPQTGACMGGGGTPQCCNEEWCGRAYETSGGKPPDHMVQKGREE